jgi:hypothetical protein
MSAKRWCNICRSYTVVCGHHLVPMPPPPQDSPLELGDEQLGEIRATIGDVLQRLYTVHLGLAMPYLPDTVLPQVMQRYSSRAMCLKDKAREALAAEVDEMVNALRDIGVL